MSVIGEGCSHGKTWKQDCVECDAVWFNSQSLPELKRGCQHAAAFIEKFPGLVQPSHTAELYRLVAKLLRVIEDQARGA